MPLHDLSAPELHTHLLPALSPASFSPGAPVPFSHPASTSSALLSFWCQTLKAPSPMGVPRSDSLLHSLSRASAGRRNNHCVWSQRVSIEPQAHLWASSPFYWVKRITPTHSLSRKCLCAQPPSQGGLERQSKVARKGPSSWWPRLGAPKTRWADSAKKGSPSWPAQG